MINNLILNSDSYKTSHWLQYPPNTSYVSSYIEARAGEDIVFTGVKGFIKDYLHCRKTIEVEHAERFCSEHGVPFNKESWKLLENWYNRGEGLPIRIQAVPEGTIVPSGNVLLQIRNTHPDFYWLTSYLETSLLRAIWYPTSVATNSRNMKKIIKTAMEMSCDNLDGLEFKLHDFGARGATSEESARIAGAAHLINFKGTDTMEAVEYLNGVYHCGVRGFSVPASEHSTMTSWGRSQELEACSNMIDHYGKENKIFSIVSDSYDIYNCVENIFGEQLKDKIVSLGKIGAKLVVRPDSGDIVKTPIEVFNILAEKFGFTLNSKGFKMLPPYLGILQGDGLNKDTLQQLCTAIVANGISMDNFVCGMGGGLLQGVTRDTYKFAMKCSAICVDGTWRDVYKDPISDKGKKSKKGVLALYKNNNGEFLTTKADYTREELPENFKEAKQILEDYYNNGTMYYNGSFDDICNRAQII